MGRGPARPNDVQQVTLIDAAAAACGLQVTDAGLEAVLGNMDENDRELVASLSFADFGPLNLAASSGYMVIRKYLVEQLGFDINSDASGHISGLEAVLDNMDENDRELVASLSFVDFGPLNLPASSGDMVICKYLVEQLGFDTNSDASGHSSGLKSLHCAVSHETSPRHLLEKGADPSIKGSSNGTASLHETQPALWTKNGISESTCLGGRVFSPPVVSGVQWRPQTPVGFQNQSETNPSVSIVPARSSSGVSDFGAIGDNLSGTYGTSGQATLPIKLAPPPAPEVAEVASSLLPNKPAPAPAPAPEVAEVAKNQSSLLQKKPAPAPEVAEVAIMPKKSKNIICLGGLLVLLVAGLLFVVVCRLKRRKDAGRIRPQTELSGTSTRWQTADEVIRNQHVEIPMTEDAPFLGPVTRARLNSLIKDKATAATKESSD
ncbi:hypothetical protein ACQ4PT_062649 [Festuca glaucescens]